MDGKLFKLPAFWPEGSIQLAPFGGWLFCALLLSGVIALGVSAGTLGASTGTQDALLGESQVASPPVSSASTQFVYEHISSGQVDSPAESGWDMSPDPDASSCYVADPSYVLRQINSFLWTVNSIDERDWDRPSRVESLQAASYTATAEVPPLPGPPPQSLGGFDTPAWAESDSIDTIASDIPPLPSPLPAILRPDEPAPETEDDFTTAISEAIAPLPQRLPQPPDVDELPPIRIAVRADTALEAIPPIPGLDEEPSTDETPEADTTLEEDALSDDSPTDLSEPQPSGDERFGQEPEDTSLLFLRQETVLLDPCEWQFDIGLSYSVFEGDFTDVFATGPPLILAETRIRERLLLAPMEVRYGLPCGAQAFARIPVGWVGVEVSRIGADLFADNTGVGDLRGGVTVSLRECLGSNDYPDIIGTFAFTAPTGETSFLQSLLGGVEDNLGEGFWAASWNLLFIHTYDPVVLFYGFGSRHRVKRDFNGTNVEPGGQYNYQLGVGFAINEAITLSTVFFGSYVSETQLDGTRLQGTILEPMSLRFAATVARPRNIVEPFAEIGMTEDAPSARIGITWTY